MRAEDDGVPQHDVVVARRAGHARGRIFLRNTTDGDLAMKGSKKKYSTDLMKGRVEEMCPLYLKPFEVSHESSSRWGGHGGSRGF